MLPIYTAHFYLIVETVGSLGIDWLSVYTISVFRQATSLTLISIDNTLSTQHTIFSYRLIVEIFEAGNIGYQSHCFRNWTDHFLSFYFY